MAELIALRYVGGGAYRPDVPARDLDRSDIAGLSEGQKAAALGCGLYVADFEADDGTITTIPKPRAAGPSYGSLTKKELIALATERGVEIDPKATNAVITEALTAADAAAAETPDTGPDHAGGITEPGN